MSCVKQAVGNRHKTLKAPLETVYFESKVSKKATGINVLGIIKNLIYDKEMKYFPTQKSDSTLAHINTNKSQNSSEKTLNSQNVINSR